PEAREVLAEQDGTLAEDVVVAGGVLVTTHLEDAAPVLRRWSLDGEALGHIDITGGTVLALDGDAERDELLVTVSSVTSASQAFHVTPSTGAVRELSFLEEDWEPPAVRVTRHRARSADGTLVPYWLVRREDAPAGPVPTLQYGYGGFNVPLGLWFSPTNIAWVSAGGAVAVANLRGGGEFGAAWYDGGRLANKQNVFDDFAAVAHHLVAEGVTTHRQLAAYGGSNGGLLVGALITQHPDIVAAAAPMVGVLDLLRFHKFTIGSAWISDYGDPDVAEDFGIALAYSPLHNVTDGAHYPATIVVTGDHDDRVVPAHSHKFTATLQAAQGGDAPILTRVETSTGHGAGKPRAVAAQEIADVITFFAHHTGLTPPS
ncbi:MAG: prolyl oligopeptidase family serine peptidase, partial [Mobilicoccus sp.]|nr:prolyl oligopeptidase family serine peptidase [Mobilicoccus sp.]